MKKLMLTVASAALGVGIAWPATAQTSDADCKTMFETADVNKDGSLGPGEADKYVVLMSTKPKDANLVTLDEFLAECQKDAFKDMKAAAVAPAPDTNTAAKDSASENVTAEQPSTSTEQSAAVEQPAAGQDSSSTTTSDPAVTAEQPAAGQDPAVTAEQPAAGQDPAVTAEQPTTTTGQDAASSAEQPAATEQPAVPEQPAAGATAEATTMQTPASVMASNLIGTTVMSVDNRNVGEINDIVIDIESEKAAHAIIGVGGFLGIGEKNVAIELNRLNIKTDSNTNTWTIVLETTEDELNQLPEYQAAAK